MAGNTAKKPGDTTNTAPNDEECVSKLELRDMMRAMTEAFSKYQDASALSFERLDRRVSGLVDRMDTMETRLPQATATGAQASTAADNDDAVDDAFTDTEAPLRRRLDRNRQGIAGNNRCRSHNTNHDNDPYAKVKFSIPSFYGAYDAETYLDWEMTVEQKFSSHLVPEHIGLDKLLVSSKTLISFGGMNLLIH